MPSRDIKKHVANLEAIADKLRIDCGLVVEEQARKLLRDNPGLNEFISAMGGIVITVKKDGDLDPYANDAENYDSIVDQCGVIQDGIMHDWYKAFPEFSDLVEKLESISEHSTGSLGIRFTADGPRVTDW